MNQNYKITVNVEILECAAAPEMATPQEQEPGHFEFVISAAQARDIDACEAAVLQVNYPAIRTALAAHLSAISQKKSQN